MTARGAVRNRLEYGFVRAFEGLVRFLPWSLTTFLTRRIADLVHALLRSKVKLARENAARALGLAVDDPKVARIVRESVRHFLLVPVELLRLDQELARRPVREILEVRGGEHLDAVRAAGTGCIYLTGHVGNWEVLGAASSLLGYPMLSVARAAENPLLHRWLHERRCRFGQQVTEKAGASREIVRTLREGGCVGMLLDQHAGRHGLRVPFLGRWASTFPSAAHLARRLGVPLVVGMSFRRGGPLELLLEVGPPIHPDPSLSDEEDHFRLTLAYSEALGRMVREHPEQYLWLHRRWRPGGTEPDPAWLGRYGLEREETPR